MKLEGRVALVTGASRGIGAAIAVALADEGAAVAVNYRAAAGQAEQVVEQIRGLGREAVALQADVSTYQEAAGLVRLTVEQLGGLHILVNNAGITDDALLLAMKPDAWQHVMQVNFGGTINCTQAVLPHFRRQRQGVIINVSSLMGERGWVGVSTYAASKGAINAFTRSCAAELARMGVRVNAVLPGFVSTEMVADLEAKDDGKALSQQIPLRRLASAEDVAKTVAFLAGPDAAHMTGSLVTIDGGASAMLGVGRPLK